MHPHVRKESMMLEVVFSKSAEGGLKAAQHCGGGRSAEKEAPYTVSRHIPF